MIDKKFYRIVERIDSIMLSDSAKRSLYLLEKAYENRKRNGETPENACNFDDVRQRDVMLLVKNDLDELETEGYVRRRIRGCILIVDD